MEEGREEGGEREGGAREGGKSNGAKFFVECIMIFIATRHDANRKLKWHNS